MTTLELAALAEAMAPYGIESFDEVLKPLWLGISAMANDPADACTFCRAMILNPCPASTTMDFAILASDVGSIQIC
jgi:hypothetical protein